MVVKNYHLGLEMAFFRSPNVNLDLDVDYYYLHAGKKERRRKEVTLGTDKKED